MDSTFKMPGTPAMPLFPISPERVNAGRGQPQSPNGFPMSPSLPDLGKPKHNKANSDVQGMVARFNSLDIKDHAELRKKDEAALKRAQLGREEAEEQLRRVREETRRMKRELDEGGERERKMMKRLDVVMEDLHRSKETHHHAQTVYEKEIRRARKEAFKSSSIVVKLQEELKSTRNSLRVAQSDLDLEKHKVSRREQDAFTAQYEIVGVQEKLTQAQEQIKIIEEERDTLKTSLKEEEVARVAAEGRIALPPSHQEDDEFASPKKGESSLWKQATMMGSEKASKGRIELEHLRQELKREVRLRELAQDRIDFMKMECQFQCCSCRIAEYTGIPYIHDGTLDAIVQLLKPNLPAEEPPAYGEVDVDELAGPPTDEKPFSEPSTRPVTPEAPVEEEQKADTCMVFSPESGTFCSQAAFGQVQEPSSAQPKESAPSDPDEQQVLVDRTNRLATPVHPSQLPPQKSEPPTPQTLHETGSPASLHHHPQRPIIRTVTTTTTIPLSGGLTTPTAPKTALPAPSTDSRVARSHTPTDYPTTITPAKGLTREEAIERLRQQRADHRGREAVRDGPGGKESAGWRGTPMKRAVSHHHAPASEKRAGHRRDISAPAMGGGTPGKGMRR